MPLAVNTLIKMGHTPEEDENIEVYLISTLANEYFILYIDSHPVSYL